MIPVAIAIVILFEALAGKIRRATPKKNVPCQNCAQQTLQAIYFHCYLVDRIFQMINDPRTTEADWNSLLSHCRLSDEWLAETHTSVKFSKKEDFIKTLMA